MKDFKLCFIRDNSAYFTTAPLEVQWGDDWDDAPYEHNAGSPYEEEGVDILEIGYVAPSLITPGEDAEENYGNTGMYNSPYSVEDINAGKVAWLKSDELRVYIHAGVSPQVFADKVRSAGGEVFIPKGFEKLIKGE